MLGWTGLDVWMDPAEKPSPLRALAVLITKKLLATCLTCHLFLVSIFSFWLLPTGSSLMKLGPF